jgi:subtilisin family serine protease
LTHPDLNVYRDVTFVPGTTSGNDDNGHGTHVAGIAAAKDNNEGVVGVDPGARLWAVKVLDSTGAGSISDIIAGIDYVTQHANEIGVANLSFGCRCHSNALDIAIHNSVAAGITFVVAAGNSAADAESFSPASNPDVITVAAIADSDGRCGGLGPATKYGNDDSFATFSNFGSVVDIAAPGVNILSTYKGGLYATFSGTSMAAPHVTGAAALYKSTHIGASPFTVKQALMTTGSTPATVCDGNGHGYFSGAPNSLPNRDGLAYIPLLYVRQF